VRFENFCFEKLLFLALSATTVGVSGCASGREFWTYVVEPPVEKSLARPEGTAASPGVVAPHTINVSYSDGSTATQVQVPVLSSGQQIVIDHKGRPSGEALHLAPIAPTVADKSIEEAYLKGGKSISQKAAPVSIIKTQATVKKLVKQGNLSLALEYVVQLLQRYPQHVESLRTKGSILLKMGEREGALESYRKAEEIESDPQVRKQIQDLESSLNAR
jgi:hypothetical protein